MTEVLLGFMVAAWIFTVGAGSYIVWRYVFKPWQVVRKDISALNQVDQKIIERLDMMEKLTAGTRIHNMTDEQLANYEMTIRSMRAERGASRS